MYAVFVHVHVNMCTGLVVVLVAVTVTVERLVSNLLAVSTYNLKAD